MFIIPQVVVVPASSPVQLNSQRTKKSFCKCYKSNVFLLCNEGVVLMFLFLRSRRTEGRSYAGIVQLDASLCPPLTTHSQRQIGGANYSNYVVFAQPQFPSPVIIIASLVDPLRCSFRLNNFVIS